MTVLAWWAIPIVATALALGWAAWVSRSRPRPEAIDTVEDYQRFRTALASVAHPQASHVARNAPREVPQPTLAPTDDAR